MRPTLSSTLWTHRRESLMYYCYAHFRSSSPLSPAALSTLRSRFVLFSPTLNCTFATLLGLAFVVIKEIIGLRDCLIIEQVCVFRRRIPRTMRRLVVTHQEEGFALVALLQPFEAEVCDEVGA